MPRHSSKSGNSLEDTAREERAIREEKESLWAATRRVLMDRRTQIIIGLLLLAFAVLAAIAYVSYLFTGTADQSILGMDRADRISNRVQVTNLLGLPGAALAQWMIDGTFGFVSILLALMIGLYGLRLMHAMEELRCIRLLCVTVFWVIWGSTVLGFAQQMIHLGVYRWGGAFGAKAALWLTSYVHVVGTIAILAVLLTIFLIVTDPKFIDRCKAFGAWCAGLFHRKKKEPSPVTDDLQPTDAEGTEVVLDIPVETDDEPAKEDNEVTFTIEPIEEEQTDGKNADGEVTLTIEEPVPVEEPEEEPLPDDGGPADGTLADLMQKEAAEEEKGKDAELEIEDVKEDEIWDKAPETILEKLGPYDPRKDLEFYKFPGLDLLKVYDNESAPVINEEEQRANGARIVTTLRNYGIEIDSIKATVGPTVTLYEIVPKAGVRVAKIQALENDIMLSLSATGIRIIAPMPGKGTIGIEVPNEKPQTVSMHSVIASKRFQEEQKMRLPIAYGRTITNEVFMFDLAKTPHLLVAGATGTGKSVAINAIITSLLYKKHPAELKLVMVDPKMVEFAPYKPLLKHFLAAMPDTDPDQVVITECDRVINTLNSLVIEMENRYKLLMDAGVRNLEDYNDKFIHRRLNPNKQVADGLHQQLLTYIVIIIDEYADFIMEDGQQVERHIERIAQ